MTRPAASVLALLLAAALAACGSLSRQDYGRIQKGMSRAEVEAILGPGARVGVGTDIQGDNFRTSRYVWKEYGQRIYVSFVNDRVVGKDWLGR